MDTNHVLIGNGISITIVRDGTKAEKGNFLGMLWMPPQGGYEWYADNGDHGECETEIEALEEIKEAWGR